MSAKSSSSSSVCEETTVPTGRMGVRSEKRHFTCRLERVVELLKCKQLIGKQELRFKMGDSIGLPTSWTFYLQEDADNGVIDAFFKVSKKPEDVKAVYASYKVKIKKVNGDIFSEYSETCIDMTDLTEDEGGMGFSDLIALDADLTDVVKADGSLLIEIDFELFSGVEDLDLAWKIEAFGDNSVKQFSKDMRRIFTVQEVNANAATTIISKDNQEFPVNRGVLAARSAVLQRMFQAEMAESITGVVRMDDLSGKTLNVLLYCLCTGALHQDWKSPDVIPELMSAAHKYELHLFTAFLDDVVGMVATKKNAMRLAILARTLGMKKAEMELFSVVKKHATSLEDFMVESAGGPV